MSEEQQTYEEKINPDTINAEYLRSIGVDRRKIAEAEFTRIAPSIVARAKSWNESQFKITISSFIYGHFVDILRERGFFNICSREVDATGQRVEVRFEW